MGEFAFSCALSNLPIPGGTPVRAVLLSEGPYCDHPSQAVYLYDMWFPRAFPLRGTYDGYGGVDVPPGPERDLWQEGLRVDLIERRRGKNPVHDVPTSKSMGWQSLVEALVECRVAVRRKTAHRSKDRLRVGMAVIREDVWQALSRLPDGEGSKSLERWQEEIREARQTRLDAARLYRSLLDSDDPKEREVGETLKSVAGSNCRAVRNGVPGVVGRGDHFGIAVDRGLVTDEFVAGAAELARVEDVMEVCRMYWIPIGRCGPQFPHWKLHERMLGELSRICRERAVDDP